MANLVANLRIFCCTITGWKNTVVPQNWQISGMHSYKLDWMNAKRVGGVGLGKEIYASWSLEESHIDMHHTAWYAGAPQKGASLGADLSPQDLEFWPPPNVLIGEVSCIPFCPLYIAVFEEFLRGGAYRARSGGRPQPLSTAFQGLLAPSSHSAPSQLNRIIFFTFIGPKYDHCLAL